MESEPNNQHGESAARLVEVLVSMGETILVVDSSGTRRALINLLLRAGFEVRTVAANATTPILNGSAAPSAVLLGLDQDEIPTSSTLAQLRQIAPDITIIVLCANTDVRTKAQLLELGADDYVQEPFEPLELLARVHSFIRRRKLRSVTAGSLLNLSRP